MPTTQPQRGYRSPRRRRRQGGQEILEFGLVAILFVPLLLGTFVTGMNLIKSVQAKSLIRDLDDIYIHGGDFSTYPYQQLAARIAGGLNMQSPSFAGNLQSNLQAGLGDGVIWVTRVMYVGLTTETQCLSVAPTACNSQKFVFEQRIVFGNSSLIGGQHVSIMGNPTGATLASDGTVSNPVTDTNAALTAVPQAQMRALWITPLASPRTPLGDGQFLYVVEGYFQTPSLSMGTTFNSSGVFARYFF